MSAPLSGVRIIDLSAYVSGPFGAQILAEQGADVVKVEPLGLGDAQRHSQPARGGLSAMFAPFNRNKRSIALNLRDPDGKAALTRLIETADVVVQNFRPGVIERLGFGHEHIAAINPHTILVSITGFGAEGPYAQRKAYDGIVQAAAGVPAAQVDLTTGLPQLVRTALCDKLTAVMVAQAVAAALAGRERDHARKGQHVEVQMLDTALWFMWPDTMCNEAFVGEDAPQPVEFSEHFRLRKTTDGHLVVMIASQAEFESMCTALGCPDVARDPRFNTIEVRNTYIGAANDAVAPYFAKLTTDEAYRRLLEADVPVHPITGLADLYDDPQVRARDLLVERADRAGGVMRYARHPVIFDGQRPDFDAITPKLGEHTREILESAGLTLAEITDLIDRGVAAVSQDGRPRP